MYKARGGQALSTERDGIIDAPDVPTRRTETDDHRNGERERERVYARARVCVCARSREREWIGRDR